MLQQYLRNQAIAYAAAVVGVAGVRLYPKMQWRFGFMPTSVCQIGTGTMDEVWHGRALPVLFLDAASFHIAVSVRNRVFGELYGYHRTFTVTENPCAAWHIPRDVLPVREEGRE